PDARRSRQPLPSDARRGGHRGDAEGAERHLGLCGRPLRLAAVAAGAPSRAGRRDERGSMMRKNLLAIALSLAAMTATSAAAEDYPARPIKIVVSTSAGGITDVVARLLGHYITGRTGQTVVIDNRAGAGGNIAMDAVAKSPPDGYTLGVANTGNIVINPYLYRQMPYDPLTDLVPVASLGEVPLFLVVSGKLPVTSLQEFVAYAKSH